MDFLSNAIQPLYVICTETYFYKWCGIHNNCRLPYGGQATLGKYVDSRYGEDCGPTQLCNCGC